MKTIPSFFGLSLRIVSRVRPFAFGWLLLAAPGPARAAGTFTVEYRPVDPGYSLKAASLSAAPSDRGHYIIGSLENGIAELPFVSRTGPGGGVRWSFLADDPGRTTSFRLDGADGLIVLHHDAAINRTEVSKYDPADIAAPVYSRTLPGNQRFAVDTTLQFRSDALFLAANLNGRVQVGRWADPGMFDWATELITERPDPETPGSIQEEASFSVRLDWLGGNLGVFWETAAPADPSRHVIHITLVNPEDGAVRNHASYENDKNAVFGLGRGGLKLAPCRVYSSALGLNAASQSRLMAVSFDGQLVRALQIDNAGISGSPRGDDTQGVGLGTVPVGGEGGNEFTLVRFNADLSSVTGLQFGFAPGDLFRNQATQWGFCFPNRFYLRGIATSLLGARNDYDAWIDFTNLSEWLLERTDPPPLFQVGGHRFDLNLAPTYFYRHRDDNFLARTELNENLGEGFGRIQDQALAAFYFQNLALQVATITADFEPTPHAVRAEPAFDALPDFFADMAAYNQERLQLAELQWTTGVKNHVPPEAPLGSLEITRATLAVSLAFDAHQSGLYRLEGRRTVSAFNPNFRNNWRLFGLRTLADGEAAEWRVPTSEDAGFFRVRSLVGGTP